MTSLFKKISKAFNQPRKVKDVSNEPMPLGEILNEQIKTGLEVYKRPSRSIFFSSLAAGLEVGFSLYALAVVYTLLHEDSSPATLQFALAFSYPLGFVFVVLGRSELFTEQTTLAVLPVLNKDRTLQDLFKISIIIYIGNLIGGYIIAGILVLITPPLEVVTIDTYYHLAHKMIKFDGLVMTGSAILAGWLMGLLSWLVSSSQDTISRIFIVILITAVIGMGNLHHSIVGSVEVFAGWLTSDKITIGDYLHFQFFTTLGNIIGGVLFVSIVKFASINRFNVKKGKI